jgi:heterodisulfide reductase subunit B
LSHTACPFCSGYFEDRVSLFAKVGLDFDLPIIKLPAFAGMTTVHHYTQLVSVEMGWALTDFFA